ncbi:MAG: component of the polarisome [Vezdaea aestivalis]|nr:MAG: component of the polarisome [Vezdaea aestivalis]
MNGRAGPLSPISPDGSEWSGISKYQPGPHDAYGPPPGSRGGGLASPPISSGSNGTLNGAHTYGSMNGIPNGMARGPHDAPGNPSPPSSIARSSVGTGMYAASDSGQSRKGLLLQEILSEHYVALKRYLAASLREDKANPRPNRARDKLLRLSAVQFQELSTDVFDELLRRQEVQRYQSSGAPPDQGPPQYLLPKDTFHPKRNQARQKLSTLPPPRFRDLATDVYYELERRFPAFIAGDIDRVGSPASVRGMAFGGSAASRPGSRGMSSRGTGSFGRSPPGNSPNEYGRPLPKTFQQNTIIPNKGTMVEDDDDGMGPDDDDLSDAFGLEGAAGKRQSRRSTTRSIGSSERDKKLIADYQTQISDLQEKLSGMESRMSAKDEELKGLQGSDREKRELHDLRISLEEKLQDAREQNRSLQSEVERARSDHSSMERDFHSQLETARQEIRSAPSGDSQLQGRYQELQSRHESLQSELREQQQITDEVKREAEGFLQEMKSMANGNEEHWEREEKLAQQVGSLEAQVKEWKSRYAKARTQLRHIRATSIGLDIPDAGKLTKDGGFTRPDGLVKDVHMTKFQIAIDELLRVARSQDPAKATDHMKAVVVAVRHISQDIAASTTNGGDQAHLRNRMTTRVSATANNLITATKNFSNSGGLSPVSLLDAAASHLTAAIVELVRTVKIRPTPPGEFENDDGEDEDVSMPLANSPNFLPIRKAGVISGESVYSPISSPRLSSAARPRSSITKDSWGRRPVSRNGGPNGKVLPQKPAGLHYTRSHNSDIEELKHYLEDQTEHLVQSIQSLVNSIRTDDGLPPIRSHITDIASVVGRVVLATETAIANTANPALKDRGEPVTRKLADCRARLLAAGAEGEKVRDASQLKEFAGRLPPLAFEIARETKELVQRIDQVEHESLKEEEEDFR